jgi:hypothetical protein
MDNLDIFVVKNILDFVDNKEYISISEVCKKFNYAIEFLSLQVKIPNRKLIYSSISYMEYAYDHGYTRFSYIYAISHNSKIDILDWIYNNMEIKLKNVVFNIALEKGNINTLKWLRKKKCLYNTSLISSSIRYKKEIVYWMSNNLFWREQDLIPLIKNNDYNTLTWVLKCVPSLGYNLRDIISETGNKNMLNFFATSQLYFYL